MRVEFGYSKMYNLLHRVGEKNAEKDKEREKEREWGGALHISQLFSISVYGVMPKHAYHVPWAAMEFISDIFIVA